MEISCDCGIVLNVNISEGRNPGCKEREEIYCPECNSLLHSGVYNDAFVTTSVVFNPNDGKSVFFKEGETPTEV